MAFQSVNDELRLLHKFCIEQGFNKSQIWNAAGPFLSSIREAQTCRTQKVRRYLIKILAVLVVVLSVTFCSEPLYRNIISVARLSTMKLLPVWDWRILHDLDCLVQNPYFMDEEDPTEEDCQVCSNTSKMARVQNISIANVNKICIEKYLPIIVEDGLRDWTERLRSQNISSLAKMYLSDPVLKMYMSCRFLSNIDIKHGDHRTFLREAEAGNIKNYYAHWENCFVEASKAFRQLYKRPYFLPAVVDILDANWVFVSSSYKEETMIPLPLPASLMVLIQIKGEVTLFLQPDEQCSKTCFPLQETLREGEIFLVTDFLYDISYRPSGVNESITIGVCGQYD
ncbi:hypothetical protein CHS0354_001270 [Potamilus streckersoni]|uniref:Uncharacterized protein n=1 Tax=Potamilus streckersoni TaxID=2493646 RepID=A0AAE0S7A7_9BIVA|nr:hypothetical protein CHS0354_001270 [Potamilus streckersoni]